MSQQTWLPGVEVVIADRDAWTTPEWLWSIPLRLARRDSYCLDPCTNAYSSVPADRKIMPPNDGLSLALRFPARLVWLNPPYSDVLPWFVLATELARRGAWVFGVVPHAPEIRAWRKHGPDLGWSLGRVDFEPPPGVGKGNGGTQEHDLVLWRRAAADHHIAGVERLIVEAGRPPVYSMTRRAA